MASSLSINFARTVNTTEQTDRLKSRRQYAVWAAVAICALLPYPFVLSLMGEYSEDVGANTLSLFAQSTDLGALATMHLLGALFAFTAALIILMRFSSLGNRLYLVVGLGFFVAGTEDLLYGVIANAWPKHSTASGLLLSNYIVGKIVMVGLFFFAFVVARQPKARSSVTRRDLVVYSSLMLTTGIVLAVPVALLPLFELQKIGSKLNHLVDVTLLLLFVATLPFGIRHFNRDPGPFQSSLVVCLILFVASQFYVFHSVYLFDPPYIASNTLTLCSYIAPLLGVSRSLMDQHRRLERQGRQLENQAALLWQQSNSLIDANRLLKDQAKDLEAASRLKSEFLANMSHELRTPLNAIIGFSESLLDCSDTDALTEWQVDRLGKVRMSGQHLLNVINDILDLAKGEAGKATLRLNRYSMNRLVEEVGEVLAPIFERKPDVELLFSLKESNDDVLLDREKVKQILTNLLGNACKFTDRGSVTASAHYTDDRVVVEVRDTGIGIAADETQKIFEQFRQGDGGSTRRAGGTGLGLALVKQLTELMKGTVTVESQRGIGSTFRVELPRDLRGIGKTDAELACVIVDDNIVATVEGT